VIVSVKTIAANLTLGGLAQTYDGNPKSVTVTTDPVNLNTVVTYNGSTSLPTSGGSYAVLATINENSYSGSVSGTLVIAKISQTITFGLDSATAKVGDAARPLIATSSSGLSVTLTSSDSRIATITSGNTLNIVGVGTTTITATQTGDGNYEAAMPVSVSLTVSADVLKYAFGSANGMPQNNGVTAVPVMSGNQMTYTFDVKDDSPPLTVTYQTSTDLVTWTTAQSVSPGTGAAPTGFLKKQVVVTGSERLFVRLNVSR
jgi:hypothetical protein